MPLDKKYFRCNRAATAMVGQLLLYCPERQKGREATAPPTAGPRTHDHHKPRRGQWPIHGHQTRHHWSESRGASQLGYIQYWQETRNGHTAIAQILLMFMDKLAFLPRHNGDFAMIIFAKARGLTKVEANSQDVCSVKVLLPHSPC